MATMPMSMSTITNTCSSERHLSAATSRRAHLDEPGAGRDAGEELQDAEEERDEGDDERARAHVQTAAAAAPLRVRRVERHSYGGSRKAASTEIYMSFESF